MVSDFPLVIPASIKMHLHILFYTLEQSVKPEAGADSKLRFKALATKKMATSRRCDIVIHEFPQMLLEKSR